MKIMLVSSYFYPKIGGLENYALNIALGLKKNGHEVFVVTTNHESNTRTEDIVKNIRVIRLPAIIKLSNSPFDPRWYFQIRKIVNSEKPDVINAHTPVPFMADIAFMAKQKTPFVTTYHSGSLKKGKPFIDILLGLYEKTILSNMMKKSSQIISVYPSYLTKLLGTNFHLNYIPPAVDSSKYHNIQRITRHSSTLIYVGRIEKSSSWKGIDVLIDALGVIKKSIPDIQLKLIGGGDAVDYHNKHVKRLNLEKNVTFCGPLTGNELIKAYREATALVLPSKTDSEAVGTVLLEAMANGTPVIGARVGGIPNVIVDNVTGLLFEPGNSADLAQMALKIINSKSLQKTLRIRGRHRVSSHYSLSKSVEDYNAVLTKAAKPRVLLIHNIISPYRLPIFEAMNHDVNLHVIFPKSITKDRVWKFSLDNFSFGHTVLSGRTLGPLILNSNAISVLRRQRFDVLIVNNDPDVASIAIPAIVFAKLRGAKIINWSEVTSNNVDTINQISTSRKLHKRIITRLVRGSVRRYRHIVLGASDHHIGFSKAAITYLHQEGVKDQHITRTRLLMPLENLPPANARYYKNRTTKKILYVGYLNNRKGVDTLIKAFMKLPQLDTTLTIAGIGPILDELKQMAVSDSRIVFVGYVEGQEKANLYASSDIFVLPTLSDVWGLVIDEAIHYGLAVICSTAAEAKELVDKTGGVLFPPQNVDVLYTELNNLIENPEIVQSMQSHNIRRRHIAKRSKMADNIIKTIKHVS